MGDLQPLKRKGQAPELLYTNQPKRIRVLTGPDGAPRMVQEKHSARMVRVAQVRDMWRVDDTWWREPIARTYYELELQGGSIECVFQDDLGGEWYRQRYMETSPESTAYTPPATKAEREKRRRAERDG